MRESFYGEKVIWRGQAEVVEPPLLWRLTTGVFAVFAIVLVCFAAVSALTLGASATPSLSLAFAAAALALASRQVPRWWIAGLRYTITEGHVIVQHGRFRRTMDRYTVSYARISWSQRYPGCGDVELVRAVPMGALSRQLRLRLRGVTAPARVWSIVRGMDALTPVGHGQLRERLDAGEQLLWSARPHAHWRSWLPSGRRERSLVALSTLLLGAGGVLVAKGWPALWRLHTAGLPLHSVGFVGLALGQTLTVGLLAAIAWIVVSSTLVARARLTHDTQYLITDKRVLIQRGQEELYVERGRIVEVVEAPAPGGLRDLFFVLDGPRARALATSGAFREADREPELAPVFEGVLDVEGVSRALACSPKHAG